MYPKLVLRSRRLAVALAVLAIAGALTGFAVASTAGQSPANETGESALWTWRGGVVPGASFAATSNVQVLASHAGVDPTSLRAAATAPDGLTLVFGRDSTGILCSADVSTAVASGFTCLSRWSDRFALLLYSTDGGPQVGTVDRASVVGVARPDVARVSLTTPTGSQDLALNRWRGFAYTSSSPNDLPLSVTAYSAGGTPLETDPVNG